MFRKTSLIPLLKISTHSLFLIKSYAPYNLDYSNDPLIYQIGSRQRNQNVGSFDMEATNIEYESITTQRLQVEMWLSPLLTRKTKALIQKN